MLAGYYNLVWEYINVGQVLSAARRFWTKEDNVPSSLEEPLIRSLGRTGSLFDSLSAWNKIQLRDLPPWPIGIMVRCYKPLFFLAGLVGALSLGNKSMADLNGIC